MIESGAIVSSASGSRGRRRPRPSDERARRSSARSRSAAARTAAEPARTIPVVPPMIASSITTPLEDVAGEAPGGQRRADDQGVDRLVEVPLVGEAACTARCRRSRIALGGPGLAHPDVVGDRDAGQADHRAEHQAEHRAGRLRSAVHSSWRARRTPGAGSWSTTSSTPGICTRPATSRRPPARPSRPSSATTARRSRGRGRGSRRRCPRLRRSPGWSAPRRGAGGLLRARRPPAPARPRKARKIIRKV